MNRMQKTLLAILAAFLGLVIATQTGLASNTEKMGRDDIISRQLDCFAKNYHPGQDVVWADVCYTENGRKDVFVGRGAKEAPARFEMARMSEAVPATLNSAHATLDEDGNVTVEENTDDIESLINQEEDEGPVLEDISPYEKEIPQKDRDTTRSGISIPDQDEVKKKSVVLPDGDLDRSVKSEFTVSSGFRRDWVNFTIAGTSAGTSPNVLSELKWNKIDSFQYRLQGDVVIREHFVIDGLAAYGGIFNGENRDSDYLGNNRAGEFSRSNNSSDEGEVMDFSGALGYRIILPSPESLMVNDAWLTGLVGYSYNVQHLVITDGFQGIPATGAFDGLHSKYDTRWQGPWIGLECEGRRQKITALARFEYHFIDYYAKADWNLRSDFQHPKSFEHEADEGYGLVLRLGLQYEMTRSLDLSFITDIQDWKTGHGIDRTFHSSGTTSETRLNEAKWQSLGFMLGLKYYF